MLQEGEVYVSENYLEFMSDTNCGYSSAEDLMPVKDEEEKKEKEKKKSKQISRGPGFFLSSFWI